jgi:hypothetical protein
MMPATFATPRAGRAVALCLIVVAHIALALCWPSWRAPAHEAARKELALTFVTLPALPPATLPPPALRSPRVAPKPAPVRPLPAPKLAPAPAITLLAPPPAQEVAPVEAAATTPSASSMAQRAMRDVGAIDRELRGQSRDPGQRSLKLHADKFDSAIAGAFKERGPPRVVEEVLADGTRRSRIGNMCAAMENNGQTGGRDVFRDGVKTKWASCPQ